MSWGSEQFRPPTVLTIAGSDSGGAAGLQADLKTFSTLGAYGMSVITVVTAQNSTAVSRVEPLAAALVADQMDAVLSDYGADAAKTGFIGNVELIEAIAIKLLQVSIPHVVVDPVLVDHEGRAMFGPEVTQAYVEKLLPLANLITPNRYEAALLLGKPLPESIDRRWMQEVAEELLALGARQVLLKGGRLGQNSFDLFYDGSIHTHLTAPWIETLNTHGSGDSLSAAVCVYLAKGESMERSVQRAHRFTNSAIRRAAAWRLGKGHGPIDQANISSV